MVNIGQAGRICLNPEIRGACQSCLWWEWDNRQGECANSHYHICPLFMEQLFSQEAMEPPRINRAQSAPPSSSVTGLAGPPGAKDRGYGTA